MDVRITLRKDARGFSYWELGMTKELKELIGEPALCQHCHTPLVQGFYVCEKQRWRWFCRKCQISEKPLCRWEEKLTPQEPEHKHFLIKKISNDEKWETETIDEEGQESIA